MKKANDTTTPTEPPAAVLSALTRLLRPLVRLLVHFHVTFPALANLLKALYVDVAEKDFCLEGKRQTDSRITLLTGVHRKDVRRFRQQTQADASEKAASLGALLVSYWTGLPEYLDKEGKPERLPRLSSADGPSFDSLVESVSKDIRPRVVLDEWLRLGIVHIDDNDRVCLNMESFVPDASLDEKAYFLGRNLRDHIAACTHNLVEDGEPMMERSVFYDDLTDEDVAELESFSKDKGAKTLQAINRKALSLQQASEGKPEANKRAIFGVYFYHALDEGEEEGGGEQV